MRILPVLDLLHGVVVRGVAGRRSEYRPIESRLESSPQPLAIARVFRSELGLSTLYVADLDAILHERPSFEIYRQLVQDGFELWIDAGLRNRDAAERVLVTGAAAVIVGLETWPGAARLEELCRHIGSERVIFSLDLQAGKSLGDRTAWPIEDPAEIASRAVASGVRRMIVLDLSHVGTNAGLCTTELCRRLRERHPDLELITGGGVRNAGDLLTLRRAGIDGVLVASALHDGIVTRADLECLDPGVDVAS